MAVFPESMDRLDKKNVEASLATIENYIRYMTERIEHSTSVMSRKLTTLESTTKEEQEDGSVEV